MRIRVGKNIFFKITVNRLDDEPEDFTDARNVRLTVNRKYSSYQVSPLLTIRDNIIEFEFVGGGDAISGQYELHLYYEKLNEASVTGVDKFYLDFCNAFILVDLTCKEDTEFESESTSINLKGVIDRNKDGKDGLTPFIGDNGNWWIGNVDTGKPSRGKAFEYSDFTPEQIEELQKPASDMISELDKTNNAVKTNERQRIDNENARVSSENARKESEDTRESAENTRVSNEEDRDTAETGRTSAEKSRVKSEQSRVDAESNRVKAENTRVEKENARQTAETTRDTNEQSRKQAEASRVTAEQGRVTEFNRLKTESETATTNATTQANYAKSQGDSVAGTVNEIKTAQDKLTTSINNLTNILNTKQGNRALYVAAGAVYNEQTGFYELNGLTDITEEQMREIYVKTSPAFSMKDKLACFVDLTKIRTNLPILDKSGYGTENIFAMFSGCTSLEVAYLTRGGVFYASQCSRAFRSCRLLKTILGALKFPTTIISTTDMFKNCLALVNVNINSINTSISFSDSPLLSLESLQYLITKAANTSAITVTVHADVYAKIQDESQTEWHALIEAAAAKQITFATV